MYKEAQRLAQDASAPMPAQDANAQKPAQDVNASMPAQDCREHSTRAESLLGRAEYVIVLAPNSSSALPFQKAL